jgi:hypothetical protein
MSRDLPPIDADMTAEPVLPQSPVDIFTPDFPEQPAPKKKPKDGDQVPDEPRITKHRAGIMSPNGREATNEENDKIRPETPLKPGQRKAGNAMGNGSQGSAARPRSASRGWRLRSRTDFVMLHFAMKRRLNYCKMLST